MSKGFHTVDLHTCASASIPTPAIGQNGNWYVGNDDTGVSANGTPGPKGDKGDTGDKGQDVDVSRIERLEEDVSKLNNDLSVYDLTTYSGALVTFSPGSYFAYSEKKHILYISCAASTAFISSPIMTPIITLPIDIPNTVSISTITDAAMENGNATRIEIQNHTVSLSCNTGMQQRVHCYASFLMS